MSEQHKDAILSIRGLRKSFGDNEVLTGIDLDIIDGEQIAIIGPSGCGKSTFLRCINCMEDPTGGSIIFQGEDIADEKVNINTHRERIGMVFQQFNLFNNKTVIENIMLAPVYVGVRDLRAAKRKNLFIKISNLFKKEKKIIIFKYRSETNAVVVEISNEFESFLLNAISIVKNKEADALAAEIENELFAPEEK